MTQQRNKVRIIGGQFRRRLLDVPEADGLRPTPDRVRETLFNWLGQELIGLRCLDLFAGSGALGFEAASRGAKEVVLVEKVRNVASTLRRNAQLLGAAQLKVLNQDAMAYLRASDGLFDVIFVDPPYASTLLEQVLPLLAARLAADGRIYVETAVAREFAGWNVLRTIRAGQVHGYLLALAAGI
ncbi:16S rRNA (guanine(966)-N(2))-methyltransferase RsmD [Vogesella oryzae]|uniref:16S rRNA (guanine(966)-N(2))-methyltransferase RsmD n=1 Tax=Vogesella oryzae TaxID=1735285 RepID=UPI001583DF25|nr:16S rRNA (guanine(966)-N(2))-methyltransferase RsmD [Vogesella oryzae]